MFPDNAKITCVPSLVKRIDDKYSVLTFDPIAFNVLNTFPKIYVKKDLLISKIEHYSSPFISAYWDFFRTGHVLEDWRNKLDNNNAVCAVLTD